MVDEKEILRVSKLARLELDENRLGEFKQKFESILKYFTQLEEVDTSGVEAFFHATKEMNPRKDEVEDSIEQEDLFRNAADSFESCFRLPKVIGSEE